MIKLIASDLDGTLLLNGAQSLPEELFPLIKKLKEMGILFVAASGRQYANMKRMFAPVADEIAYISENGGLALQNDKVLYQDSFDPALVKEIVRCYLGQMMVQNFPVPRKITITSVQKQNIITDLMINVIGNNCHIIKNCG